MRHVVSLPTVAAAHNLHVSPNTREPTRLAMVPEFGGGATALHAALNAPMHDSETFVAALLSETRHASSGVRCKSA